jgi:hypothetical protein
MVPHRDEKVGCSSTQATKVALPQTLAMKGRLLPTTNPGLCAAKSNLITPQKKEHPNRYENNDVRSREISTFTAGGKVLFGKLSKESLSAWR